MTRIETFDEQHQPNGYVILCWNALEQPGERPDQVYVTAIAPGCHKGPHLHKVRCGRFICIKGNVAVIKRYPLHGERSNRPPATEGLYVGQSGKYGYRVEHSGETRGHNLITVEPGIAALIQNIGPEEALVINMPTPAWSKEQPDEWPVEDWDA